MRPCPTCGNKIPSGTAVCHFCGADIPEKEEKTKSDRGPLHLTVNIKQGRPVVETAIKRLRLEIEQAHHQDARVLSLIHGYGSSGKGGKIRIECRKLLDHMMLQGMISSYIPGEDFNRRSGAGKALLRRYHDLGTCCESDFNNPGVTIVIL